ncbi:MAG: hypothetical protein AB7I57_16930 [Pirellulales bacterium]
MLRDRVTIARMSRLLRVLSAMAAIYGIGFGLMSIPTALLVGPHLLFAALGHIAVGTLFLFAVLTLGRGQRRGVWLALVGSLLASGVGAAGFLAAFQSEDAAGRVFFALFTSYFLLTAGAAALIAARPKIGN